MIYGTVCGFYSHHKLHCLGYSGKLSVSSRACSDNITYIFNEKEKLTNVA